MNYGKFFKLNNEKSDLSLGITCYDYIWIRDDKNNDGSSEFPIYVTIGKDSIDFHAHYHDDYIAPNGKHSHNTILSLPLSANLDVKDGLTGALVEGHKTNFPRYDKEGSSYLWELHWKTFWKKRNWKKTDLDLSYFELEAFIESKEKTWEELIEEMKKFEKDGKEENDYIKEEERKADSERNEDPKKINRFIRKLILDFLFDLEQTKVFQTAQHYEYLSVKLKENFFFSALAAKANFYYWREILIREKKNRRRGKNLSVYVEYYLKAEREWTKCIRSSKAPTNFNDFKDKWFEDPEKEMDEVYDEEKFLLVNKIVKLYFKGKNIDKQKEGIEKCRKKTSEWLTWHYAWDWKFWWGKWDFLGLHLLFPRLIASVLTAWVTIIIGSDLLPAMLGKDDLETNIRTSRGSSFEIAETTSDVEFFFKKDTAGGPFFKIINVKEVEKSKEKDCSKEIDTVGEFFLKVENVKYVEKVEEGAFFRIANIGDSKLWIFIGSVIFVIHILTCYSIISKRKNNKYKGWLKYVWFIIVRPFKITIISFSFSVAFGSFLANMFSTSVPLEWNLLTYLQNPFFMSCVFLAMLIGIVLRLATDEKYSEE